MFHFVWHRLDDSITPAFAQATPENHDTKPNPNMQHMPTHQNGSTMNMMNCMSMHNGMAMDKNAQTGRGTPMGENMPCANQTARGTGVIQAIDTTKNTITIKHQAIKSIHWPAMTMTFKADPPSLLRSVKVGEKVNFTLHPDGVDSTVIALTPVK